MESAQKRFALGVLLAWAPWVPTVIGLGYAFRGLSNTKATGIEAVAGGIAELLVIWGVVTMIVSQIVAIIWLWRSLAREHVLRSLFGAVSIGMSGLMFLIMAFFVWSTWLWRP